MNHDDSLLTETRNKSLDASGGSVKSKDEGGGMNEFAPPRQLNRSMARCLFSKTLDEATPTISAHTVAECCWDNRSIDWCWNGGRRLPLHDTNVYSVSLWKFHHRTHELGKLRVCSSPSPISTVCHNSDDHQRSPLEGCVSTLDCHIACYDVLFWFARLLPITSHVCYFDAIEQIVGRERRERVSQLDSSGDA
jgi:hypothetical protein